MSPNAGEGGSGGVSASEYSCARGAQITFSDLTPYLNYGWDEIHTNVRNRISLEGGRGREFVFNFFSILQKHISCFCSL